MEIFNLMH